MLRPISLVLTLLTGFSGLVYEVAWQKYLATLLGSHSEATAAVLAIFLGGMALGFELFGRVTQRLSARASGAGEVPALLRTYGVVEVSIGIWALLFPWLFSAAQRISFLVPPGHEALSFAFDVLLCALLLGPPSVLMGGTIPLLTQALSRTVAESTRVHAWIYATNTAGAFAGARTPAARLQPLRARRDRARVPGRAPRGKPAANRHGAGSAFLDEWRGEPPRGAGDRC